MSILCPNCKSKLSCGCQKRTASNGVSVCTNCVGTYESQIKKNQPPTAPTNVGITFNNFKK